MTRLNSERRKHIILQAAVKVANEWGLLDMTLDRVCIACAVPTSEATIRRYFHTLDDLRLAVVAHPTADNRLWDQARDMGVL